MGMFDYISVSEKLPVNAELEASNLNLYSRHFQTKDLDNALATYFIQNGKLYSEKYKTSGWVEDKTSFMGGYIESKDPYLEEVPFHGTVDFYDSIDQDEYDHWVDYRAYFTHGNLDKIELIKYEKHSNTGRKLEMKKLLERDAERAKLWYNKYIFHTKVWRKIHRFLNKFLYNLETFISKVRIKIP